MSTNVKQRLNADELVVELGAMLATILAREAAKPDDDFFALGGDSLAAQQLMVAIEAKFRLVIEPAEIFERPNLSDFASYLASIEEPA